MKTLNIHDAKTRLSKLVDMAAKGEPFIIAQDQQADGQGCADRRAEGPYRRRIGRTENESKQRSRTSAECPRRHHLGLF
jgi:antitoxin (DNA-binding transcriptional repressor) of toxin-antitoxin stability system